MRHATLYIIALLLAIVGTVQPAQAMRTQDALYIFRNDGQFHFFYYGDIDQITYSKTDTLGVEQEDYVVQEVWALDSVFRIPISAIDSVAFVTPEDKVKDDVFFPDKSITDYIVASDSVWWIVLAPNTPQSLIPNVGDKFLIEQTCDLLPDGFGGRVVGRELNDDGYLIVTEPISPMEIYDRLVIKAAIAPSSQTSAAKGMSPNGILDGWTIDVPEETWDIPTFTGTVPLSHSWSLSKSGSPVSVSFDVTGSYSASLDPKLTYRGCIFLDAEYGLKADIHSTCEMEEVTELSLSGTLSGRWEIGFPKRGNKESPKTDTKTTGEKDNAKGLKFEIGAGMYLEGSISGFKVALTNTKESTTHAFTVVEHKNPLEMLNPITFTAPEYYYRYNTHIDKDETEPTIESPLFSTDFPLQTSIGAGIYIKAESKLRLPLEKAQKWLPSRVMKFLTKYKDEVKPNEVKKDTTSFGFNFGADLGAKIDMKAPWGLLFQDYELPESQPYYKSLNDNTEVSVAGYVKGAMEISLGPWKIGPSEDVTAPIDKRYLVPNITGINVKYDDEGEHRPYRIKFSAPISRDVITGVNVGFAVLDEDKKVVSEHADYGWFSEKIMESGVSHFNKGLYHMVLTDIDPAKDEERKLTAYPMVVLSTGRKLLVDQEKQFTIMPARFDISARNVFVGEKRGYDAHGDYILSQEVTVVPNMQNVVIKSEADWLDEPSWLQHLNQLSLYWDDLPKDTMNRRGVIRLYGMSTSGKDTLAVDSIVVMQGRPTLVLKPDTLKFGINGGVQSFRIEETNLTDLTAYPAPGASFFEVTMNKDNTVTVKVQPNADVDDRDAAVWVEGKFFEGITHKEYIIVSQVSGEASVSPSALNFDAEGGTKQVKIDFGDYPFYGVYVDEECAGWVSADKEADGAVKITATASVMTEQREGTVYCWVSNVSNPSESEMKKLPVTVTQSPGAGLQPITPDGDKSPFEMISFLTKRKVQDVTTGQSSSPSSGDDEEEEEYIDSNSTFYFTPGNSQFKLTQGNTADHYECKGYMESNGLQPSKILATLTFDIEKATGMVKNLQYTANSEAQVNFSMWGATAHSTIYTTSMVQLGDFPLEVNGNTEKSGKWSVSDGLWFNAYSVEQDTKAYYTIDNELGHELYPDGIDPISYHTSFVPVGDASDYVELQISYKASYVGPTVLEWPSDEVMQSLKTAGLNVYDGSTPPAITGTYSISPLSIVSDPTGEASEGMSEYGLDGFVLKFDTQADGKVMMQYYPTMGGVAVEAEDPMQALVTGSGNKFSACIPDAYGRAVIISGEMQDGVIYDLQYATCDMKKAGEHVILKDSDGSSSQTSWSPGSGLD